MARISKNSTVSINGTETRWMRFPDNVYVLNDNECNVWGYSSNSTGNYFWFQREKGTDLINDLYLLEWKYRTNIVNKGKENTYVDMLHRYYVRCVQEQYTVTKRTLVSNGVFYEFDNVGGYEDAETGYRFVKFPIIDVGMKYNFFGLIAEGNKENVAADTPLLQGIVVKELLPNPNGGQIFHGRLLYNDSDLLKIASNVAEIDGKINSYYNILEQDEFPTFNADDPQSVWEYLLWHLPTEMKISPSMKAKIAKVFHDWLWIHNLYSLTNASDLLTSLGGFSKTDPRLGPDCFGYAIGAHYLLSRYLITNVITYGHDVRFSNSLSDESLYATEHYWNTISYDSPFGVYPDDPYMWSWFDSCGTPNLDLVREDGSTVTGFTQIGYRYGEEDGYDEDGMKVTKVSWERFNTIPPEGHGVFNLQYDNPVTAMLCDTYKYTGNKVYEW